MKDLYKRLSIDPASSAQQIREVMSSPVARADAAALEAAEFVLLDKNRRAVYDRTHRVLTTIGELRLHLGLNFKTFWARGRLKDFTYELAEPQGPRRRRTIRSIRPADIRRAFGLRAGDPASDYESGRQRLLVIACLLVATAVAAVAFLIYFAIAK